MHTNFKKKTFLLQLRNSRSSILAISQQKENLSSKIHPGPQSNLLAPYRWISVKGVCVGGLFPLINFQWVKSTLIAHREKLSPHCSSATQRTDWSKVHKPLLSDMYQKQRQLDFKSKTIRVWSLPSMNLSPEGTHAFPATTLLFPFFWLKCQSLPIPTLPTATSPDLLKSRWGQVRWCNFWEAFFIYMHNHHQILNMPWFCNGFWHLIKSYLELFSLNGLCVPISIPLQQYFKLFDNKDAVKLFLYSSVAYTFKILIKWYQEC